MGEKTLRSRHLRVEGKRKDKLGMEAFACTKHNKKSSLRRMG